MAVGKEIETRNHIIGFKEEISKSATLSDDNFFTWFDSTKNKESTFVRGAWDFTVHIAFPAAKYLSVPEEKIALEIGHGGGRILSTASGFFQKVIGIDIHENNEKVSDELHNRGIENFTLIKSDGMKVPVDDNIVDFAYSFIVLQHVEKIEIFQNYLDEVYRVLKPDGIAVLYFGRKNILSLNRSSKVLFILDRVLEPFFLPYGFKEIPEKVNCTNLIISLRYAKSLAKKRGFEILSELVSHKKVPDGMHLYGGQHGLVIRKLKK